jgi:hypothetical protein
MILFWWLRTTPILVVHKTHWVEKIISLSFNAYKEHLNQRSYASCALIWSENGCVGKIIFQCIYWKMILFWWLQVTLILVYHENGCVEKIISLSFHLYKKRLHRMLYATCVLIWRQVDPRLWIRNKYEK